MEAKDFELPIEGLLSKLALMHTQEEEQTKSFFIDSKIDTKKPVKSLQKNKKPISKKKK